MKRKIWTKEELSEVFRINEKGELERLNGKYSPNGVGWSVVECKTNTSKGYCDVGFQGSIIKYHAIIWVLTNGTIEDVNAELDHIDGNRINNRIENLRLVSTRENQQNRAKHRAGRLPGCRFDKRCNKWQARIEINGKLIHLGLYNTEPEAHQIYLKALDLVASYVDNKQFRALVKQKSITLLS